MFAFKIWNEDTQRFCFSKNGRNIWSSSSGVTTALKYVKIRYKSFGGNPDRIIIKKYELKEI
jgi:hypothetical protein